MKKTARHPKTGRFTKVKRPAPAPANPADRDGRPSAKRQGTKARRDEARAAAKADRSRGDTIHVHIHK